MKTLADVQRYLDMHHLELRVRRASAQRYKATLYSHAHGELTEWSMEGDDLDGAVCSAIEAYHATTVRSVRS